MNMTNTPESIDADKLTRPEHDLYYYNKTLFVKARKEFDVLLNYPPFVLTSNEKLRRKFIDDTNQAIQDENILLEETLTERYKPLKSIEKEFSTELTIARKYASDSNYKYHTALKMYAADHGDDTVSDDDYHNYADLWSG